jgi:hypothetical protein
VVAISSEHPRTPPYLDVTMVVGTEKFGLRPGRRIVVGDYHLRRGDVIVRAQIVQSI